MDLLEISHLAQRLTSEISSGEARRILIGRALVHDPRTLILDEPTSSLDLHATHELRRTLRTLARGGIGIVMVTHHLPDIIPEMQRVVTICAGRIHGDGPKSRMLREPALSSLFGAPVELLERGGYFHVL
jgi:iron complex transport system ATP-binding protein